MICLPVLCITGNLRRALKLCEICPGTFTAYFLIGLGLTLLPDLYIFDVGISFSGAFLCLSAFAYILIKKILDYRFFIASAAALLIYAFEFVISNSQYVPHIRYFTLGAVLLTAILVYKAKAALYIPVIAFVFSAAGFIISLALGVGHNYKIFDRHEMVLYGMAICLLSSYAFKRYVGRHVRKQYS